MVSSHIRSTINKWGIKTFKCLFMEPFVWWNKSMLWGTDWGFQLCFIPAALLLLSLAFSSRWIKHAPHLYLDPSIYISLSLCLTHLVCTHIYNAFIKHTVMHTLTPLLAALCSQHCHVPFLTLTTAEFFKHKYGYERFRLAYEWGSKTSLSPPAGWLQYWT